MILEVIIGGPLLVRGESGNPYELSSLCSSRYFEGNDVMTLLYSSRETRAKIKK
jgi:hypothetical protein